MNTKFLKNKKYIFFIFSILSLFIFSNYFLNINADNKWSTNTKDGYHDIGQNISVKVDVITQNNSSINSSNNLIYNGMNSYIKIDWKSSEKVTDATSFTLLLPTEAKDQISFESPILNTKEILSEDKSNLTILKNDGTLITSFFYATASNPIKKSSTGTILVPHNIFVNVSKADFKAQDFVLTLKTSENQTYTIKKYISNIADGISVKNFALKNLEGHDEALTYFDTNTTSSKLEFDYSAGELGINKNDSILVSLNSYKENSNLKFSPFSYGQLKLKDSNNAEIGFIDFKKPNESDNNSYAKVVFTKKLSKTHLGRISIIINTHFDNQNSSVMKSFLTINNKDAYFELKNKLKHTISLKKFDTKLQDKNMLRWSVLVNHDELLNENSNTNSSQISSAILTDSILDENYYIDESSIRIVKLLQDTSSTNLKTEGFKFDADTIKDTNSINTSVGINDFYTSKSGLTIKEFEKYLGLYNIITFTKNKDGLTNGFTLNLGTLNESDLAFGEYTAISKDTSTQVINKKNKVFSYLVYYNTIFSGWTSSATFYSSKVTLKADDIQTENAFSTAIINESSPLNNNLGTLKLLVLDKEDNPLSNVYFELISKTNPQKYKFIAKTNNSGYIQFSSLSHDRYILSKKYTDISKNIDPIEFEVSQSNYSNINLKLQNFNKNRNDLFYLQKKFLDNNDYNLSEFVNVLVGDLNSGRFKVQVRDFDSKDFIGGSVFKVKNADGTDLVNEQSQLIMESPGQFVSNFLPLGEYVLVEISPANNYAKTTNSLNINVTSKDVENILTIYNRHIVPIHVFKYDPNFKDADPSPLAGSKLNLFSISDINTPLETLTIDKSGYALSKKYPYGEYFLLEFSSPDTYAFSSKKIPVTINFNTLDENNRINVNIESIRGNYLKILEQNPIFSGNKYRLSTTDNTAIELETISTNSNGEGISKKRYAFDSYYLIKNPSSNPNDDEKILVQLNASTEMDKNYALVRVSSTSKTNSKAQNSYIDLEENDVPLGQLNITTGSNPFSPNISNASANNNADANNNNNNNFEPNILEDTQNSTIEVSNNNDTTNNINNIIQENKENPKTSDLNLKNYVFVLLSIIALIYKLFFVLKSKTTRN